MKTLKLLCVLLAGTLGTYAQGDSVRDVVIPGEANCIFTGAPIDVTVTKSEYIVRYGPIMESKVLPDDIVTNLSFRGYNLGKEQTRHIKIWMSSEMHEANYKLVYDGDYTIPHGGTAEERILLLNLDLKEPCKMNDHYLYLKVECTGEAMDTPLFFDYNSWGDYEWERKPVVTLRVAPEMKTLYGTVKNEKGEPVSAAHILLSCTNYAPIETEADSQGYYEVSMPGNQVYTVTVSAPGCITYTGGHTGTPPDKYLTAVRFYDKESLSRDFLLYSTVSFKKDQRATIILPVDPNPDWGRYYRLDRRENEYVTFQREPAPQANVPYVIFPNRDFELKVSDYDFSQDAGSIWIPSPDENDGSEKWTVFAGSYQNKDVWFVGLPVAKNSSDETICYLDQTPDCEQTGDSWWRGRIGGSRAYLVVSIPYPQKPVFLFQDDDEVEGIADAEATNAAPAKVYDLQGRRMETSNFKLHISSTSEAAKPSANLKKGVYIRDGRKVVVK